MDKKFRLIAVFAAISTNAFAQSNTHIEDRVQPTPDATIKQNVVTTTTIVKGERASTDSEMKVTDMTTVVIPTSSTSAPQVASLAPAEINDNSVDFPGVMTRISNNMTKLRSATSITEMVEPAQELAKWASQAQALGLSTTNAAEKALFEKNIYTFREHIAQLQDDINTADLYKAKSTIAALNNSIIESHSFLL